MKNELRLPVQLPLKTMRITMLKTLITVIATVWVCSTTAAQDKRPNIIYILADDLGYGDLGSYGQKVIQTPNLDRMAAEGMRFTQHYAGSTVCGPSRSCMLEGKHSGHTYVRGNGQLQMRRDPHDSIFPQALQKVGYHTALIGKSGLGCNTDDAKLVGEKGFDYFFGFTSHTEAHWYFPKYLWRNDEKVIYPNNTSHDGDNYSSELVVEEALRYVEQQKDGPFFLHLSLQIPHASLRAKEKWKEKYRSILKEEPLPSADHPHYSYEREPKTTYAAMVSYMDHNMGRLMKKLNELGIADNTLVMFASDNGAMREGGHQIEHFDSNGSIRGGKRDLYEGGIRTPMIAWWPGSIKAGQVTDHVSAFWDISPTVRELSGAAPQSDTDGLSLVPTLLGQPGQKKHEYLYWEFFEGTGKRAILKDQWKLILFDTNKDTTPRAELYDLDADMEEQNDLAAKHPNRVADFLEVMNAARVPAAHPKFKLAAER